jgi:CDP-diacylglycerol---glycerol-3-phosphate 3-phosphatidyltransferase
MEPSSQTTSKDDQTLTDMLRRRTLFIIDPIVTLLARLGVSPDLLTVTGMLAHFFLAWLVAQGEMRWAAVGLMLIAPLDALDGALARKRGLTQGNFGAFLDSSLDRLAEIILFGGFIVYYVAQEDAWMLATAYIAISGSLMVSYTRARAEALHYQAKVGILSRVERYIVLTLALLLNLPAVALVAIAIFTYITVAQRIFHVWQQARTS